MLYKNINEYINSGKKTDSELWLFDSEFSKNFILKSLDPKYQPKNTTIETFFNHLEKKNKKDILSEIEVKILTEKLISKNKDLKFLEKQNSLLIGFIELLKIIRLYPSIGAKNLTENIKNHTKIIYALFKKECEEKNFKDFASNLFNLSKEDIPKNNNFNKIVLVGDFFYLSELHWKVLFNYCKKYENIVIISSLSKYIYDFYQSNDYLAFNSSLKNYFTLNSPNTLSYDLKEISEIKAKSITCLVYDDWETEINHVAYKIKDDIKNNILKPEEIGVYIPDKAYEFKINKIFNDYDIPHFTTFSNNLATHPLTKFLSFWLEMDWNRRKDVFKFLNSPFVKISHEELDTNIKFNNKFLEIDLNLIEIQEKEFNKRFIEEIMLKAGMDFILFSENSFKKLTSYFEKEAKFSIEKIEKVAYNYKLAFLHLTYFYKKLNDLKNILPNTAYANDFHNILISAFDILNIKSNYLIDNEENSFYKIFIGFLEDLTFFINKVNNKKYSLSDYSSFFKKFAPSITYEKDELKTGVIISSSNAINKADLKKIYQVGLTSKFFPIPNKNDIFSKSINKILSHTEKDIQLFTLYEMLKKKESGLLDIHFSYPILINNEENEKSEILVDLNIEAKKFNETKFENNYSKTTHKINQLADDKTITEELKKIKDLYNSRNSAIWSKYEGHLENTSDEESFLTTISVTQIEEFAKCPMKYFFNRKIKIRSIKEKTEDIEGNVKGIIVHKILEVFYNELINKDMLKISFDEKKKIINEISLSTFKDFETIYDNLYLDYMKYQFNTGLKEENKKGILYKILESDEKSIEENWLPTKTEHKFNFKFSEFNFNGSIDRIDEKEGRFRIIDYKSGNHNTTEDIKEGLAFQMPIYGMAYKEQNKKDFSHAFYYSMKDIEKIAPSFVIPEYKAKEIKTDTKSILDLSTENLEKIKTGLKGAKFNFTTNDPDKACAYCDYDKICYYNAEKINLIKNEKIKNIDSFPILTSDKFVFPNKNSNSTETSSLTDEQKLALATDKNILVTAGAGAGKTEVLTTRMLKLLDKVEGDIGKILVITFTKKATAEMQLRIYSSISKKIFEEDDENGFYLKAKQSFSDNWISTIDGFYMRILKENSLYLKLENELNISEQKEINDLITQTIEKTIDEMSKERDTSLSKLLHIWSRKQIIEHCFRLLDKFWIYDYLEGKALDDFDEVYKKIIFNDLEIHINNIDSFLSSPDYSENSLFPVESRHALINWKNEFIQLKENYETYQLPNIDDSFKLKRKPVKFDKNLNDEVSNQIKTFNTTLKSFTFAKLEKEYLVHLIEVLKKVDKNYQNKRKKDNINTFSDISNLLYKLLKNNTNGIREKLKERFNYIMIDEFQDTDQIQWEIAKYLSGWNGNDFSTLQSDKLFLVGDDKQSIYGFRGGDVQVFNSAKKEIVEINKNHNIEGGFIEFPDNFRSSKNIISFFNSFFKVLFSSNTKPYEASHQNLKGHKADGSINFFLFYGNNNEDYESMFIAKQIKEILEKNPYEKIAILFRTKKNMPKFAKALENLKINYLITGGKGFYKNSEITDLFNILAYISDKTRKIELTGFLRSAMFGLSDNEILEVKSNLDHGLKKYPEIYEKIYGKYQEDILIEKGWKHLVFDLNIHELVIKIINDTNYRVYLSNHNNSVQKIKNLEKFIEICKENDKLNINEFVEFLEYQINNNEDEANATIIEMGNIQAVQLMTIHSSKGLGFDTVILADSDSVGKTAGSGESISFGEIENFKGNFIGFKVPSEDKFDKEHTIINNKILDYIRAKDEAELKRLLYVALTRVKNNLIVSATMKRSKNTFMGLFLNYFNTLPIIEDELFLHEKINDVDFHLFNCDITKN
ncbi:MAG: UvrD-helicase domain-containing protein [Cyanobacteriota bacterium]